VVLETPALEVVYYPSPIPSGPGALTLMGLIFDKVHFPNVYLPTSGYDPEAVRKEADRIAALGLRDYNTAVLVSALRFLPLVKDLDGFCVFTGQEGQLFGNVDKMRAIDLVKALDEEIFGPPKPGFHPTYETGFHKALPDNEQYIDYPGTLHYPATAMIYASGKKIPLINDNPNLPVPALGGVGAKDNARLLTTILAMECANLVLPRIRVLHPREIMEMREELSKHLQPFRLGLLKLSAELNKAISSTSSREEIIRAACFIVETEVQPTLIELKASIEAPSKRWYNRALEVAKQVPELAASFATMPTNVAIAKVLAALGSILVDMQSEEAGKRASRSGMYYLLKLRDAAEE
jgi:hypothetical protein